MGKWVDKIKRASVPPVTVQWIDMVVTHRSEQADEIERLKGPEAADRYRRKTGKIVQRMIQRGVI